MNKKLWWAAAGAGVLLLLLIIAIVNMKEPAVSTKKDVPPSESAAAGTAEENSIELQEPVKETTDSEERKEPAAAPADSNPNQTEQPSSVSAEDKPAAAPDKTPVQPATPPAAKEPESAPSSPIKPGMYQVGTDIEPGEYIVFSDGITLLENTKDQTGNPESIVFNIALDGRSHTYVTLQQGEYFKLQGGEMYPVSSAPDLQPANGVYTDGQYKVGTDIPAGAYNLIADDKNDIGFYEISKDSRQDMMDLLVSDVVEGETKITVSNGQYLTIRNAYIEVK
ncbi:hypothetical protein [Sporosarcina sp. P33]|uniref:hypothetical protein n=1 Tax=Sporosarcina sp. P33 TaxID=1930764 RepID=UPI0009BD7F3C|nr:hypothetical protein [Sporosarcina sp. P33]ARD47100.1 hypothetical protein SporoP33_01805 [Sporosarcina sp. P33]